MGALPKQRVSKARKGERRSHMHLEPPQLTKCSRCKQPKLSHHMCPACGTYKGQMILEPKRKKRKSAE